MHVDPDDQHDKIVLYDHKKNNLIMVASGLDTFIAYQTRAFARDKRAKTAELPPEISTRVQFDPKLNQDDYAIHNENNYTAHSRITELIHRTTWIVDLLNNIPKLPRIITDYLTHTTNTTDRSALRTI